MSRQFKNRKAVDPYGKDYSQIPNDIQWGDMMISKDATPEAWERYAAKIKAGEESPKPYRNSMRQRTDRELIERGLADNEAKLRYSYNSALQKKESSERLLRINTLEDARREFPNRPDDELRQILDTTNKTRKYLEADAKKYAATGGGFPTYEEWKIQAETGEKEHQRRMQAQTQPLRSVPEGTIREPLFGRNPDGSPKPRPPGMDSEEVAALAAAQERKYNPPQKATKKTASSTSAKPASTPPGVIGYDALNQPVYGRTAPTVVLENAIWQGMNRGMSRAEAEKYAKEEMASTNYRPPSEGASNLNPKPVRSAGLPEAIVRELTVRAARGDSNAARNLSNIQKAERSGSMPDYKTVMPSGSVWSGSYDNAGNPIYGVPVPGMKVNLPKGSPLPKDQVLAMRQKAIDADKQRQADWSTGGRPTKEALLAKQGITGNNQALAVWTGSYDSNGDPRYGIPVPGMKANVPKGQPLNREQALAQREALKQTQQYKDAVAFDNSGKPGSRANPLPGQTPTGEPLNWVKTGVDKDGHPTYGVKLANNQSIAGGNLVTNQSKTKGRAIEPASTQPYRDMQGNAVKLDDMYISGGLGKSAESKKQSDAAKRKASQPASTKGTGQSGGSFRVINGQVRFFGSGADAAKEVDPVKPTGMR